MAAIRINAEIEPKRLYGKGVWLSSNVGVRVQDRKLSNDLGTTNSAYHANNQIMLYWIEKHQ
jgi:hypothetical protein